MIPIKELNNRENVGNSLNESDDFDWMKEIPNKLPKDKDWWIINDIDPYNLEVSKEIQNFLFKQAMNPVTKRF